MRYSETQLTFTFLIGVGNVILSVRSGYDVGANRATFNLSYYVRVQKVSRDADKCYLHTWYSLKMS